MKICILLLGRMGDIINFLPAAKWYRDQGHTVDWCSLEEYGIVLHGCSYINEVYTVRCGLHQIPEIQERLRQTGKYDQVITPQIYGNPNPVSYKNSSFDIESWNMAGIKRLDLWSNLPLIFDKRDSKREAEVFDNITAQMGIDQSKPILLFNLNGMSSPLGQRNAEKLDAWIHETFRDRFSVLNLSFVRIPVYYDLLGLYERSAALISICTSTLHLSRAVGIPTVALLGTRTWGRSSRRPHWIYETFYDVVFDHLNDIKEVVNSI